MYFGENRLFDLADTFYKNAGEYLFIDEIHKYTDWSQELKSIYDSFRQLHECFCPASAFVTADSDVARNPQRFHTASRF